MVNEPRRGVDSQRESHGVYNEHPLTAALRVVREPVSSPPASLARHSSNEQVGMTPAAATTSEPAKKPKRATIGKRPKNDAALSDATLTPKWLAELLPHRRLDPVGNPRSHVKADVCWSLETGDDALARNWLESAFVNWPFSAPLPFAEKCQHEMNVGRTTDLIVLCKLDPSTRAWKVITRKVPGLALDLWMPDDRIQFEEHPELIERRRLERIEKAIADGMDTAKASRITGDSTANFVSVLLHHRPEGSEPWRKFALFAKRWGQL